MGQQRLIAKPQHTAAMIRINSSAGICLALLATYALVVCHAALASPSMQIRRSFSSPLRTQTWEKLRRAQLAQEIFTTDVDSENTQVCLRIRSVLKRKIYLDVFSNLDSYSNREHILVACALRCSLCSMTINFSTLEFLTI